MALPTTPFCSDEEVCIRAGADFSDLVPGDQALAAGDDGAFDAGDRWTLLSDSADFAAQGAAAGQVAVVYLPSAGDVGEAQHLIVDGVPVSGVTLRRKGLGSGVGQPPGPPGGTDGVRFTVATMAAEIARASFDLGHRLGIDENVPGRGYADLADPTQLVEPTVLTVLYRRYSAIAQRGSPDTTANPPSEAQARAASFWAKARQIKQELDDCLARLQLRFVADPAGESPKPRWRRIERG